MQYANIDDDVYSYQLDIELLQTMGKPLKHEEGTRFLKLKEDLQKAADEYKQLTDEVITATKKYDAVSNKLFAIKKILNEMDPIPIVSHKIEELLDDFRKEEKIDELEKILNDIDAKRAEYKSIFKILRDVETHNIYCCFLCLERNVTVFIDPCGHLMCETCEKKLGAHSCPFCRSNVRMFRKLFMT